MDRPILFSAPMVRALLAGTKTQTRRIVKIQPDNSADGILADYALDATGKRARFALWYMSADERMAADWYVHNEPQFCPYGQLGDRLWVREVWARDDEDGQLMYRADVGKDPYADAWEQGRNEGVPRYRWKPSIHMPRAASRITLEITGVRVERLQDISEADALAEGVTPKWEPGCSGRLMEAISGFMSFHPAASAYADLWEQINGPGSWDANPWVWVVEFKRVGGGE